MDTSASYSSIKFPQLAPRYNGMPRRYEETKPVVIQDFTHRKIVGIGHEIQRRLLERLEAEKSEAVEVAETQAWQQAEKKKHSAVRRVRDEAMKKIDKALDQQRKEYEQKIKEEAVRVEMAMQKLAIEQVQEERAKGERALAEAVRQVEERCAEELRQAVAQARQEEQDVATRNLNNLQQKHDQHVEDLKKTHVVELAQQLALLTANKDQEREEAVRKAHDYEKKVGNEIVSKLKTKYEARIQEEASKIHEKVHQIDKLTRDMEDVEKEKERLAEFLKTTRFWFQDFIDRVQKVKKGNADFMLPPAYIEEIEKGLMIAK